MFYDTIDEAQKFIRTHNESLWTMIPHSDSRIEVRKGKWNWNQVTGWQQDIRNEWLWDKPTKK